jgi:NAD+ synthase
VASDKKARSDEYIKNKEALLAAGFERALVEMTLERIANNRFKGKLPTIADLTAIK